MFLWLDCAYFGAFRRPMTSHMWHSPPLENVSQGQTNVLTIPCITRYPKSVVYTTNTCMPNQVHLLTSPTTGALCPRIVQVHGYTKYHRRGLDSSRHFNNNARPHSHTMDQNPVLGMSSPCSLDVLHLLSHMTTTVQIVIAKTHFQLEVEIIRLQNVDCH